MPTDRLNVVVPISLDIGSGNAVMRVLAAGKEVTVTGDGPAPVAQRLVASMVNLATSIAERGIGSPADVDTGARVGLGYPRGPLSWGDAIGADRILTLLDNLQAYTRDPRYRPTHWLRARAGQHLSLLAAGTSAFDLTKAPVARCSAG